MSGFTPINRHPSGWTPINWTPETPNIASPSQQPSQADSGLQELNNPLNMNNADSVSQQRPRTALPSSRPPLKIDTQASSSNQQEELLKTPNGRHLTDAGRKKIYDLHDAGISIRNIVREMEGLGAGINKSSLVKVLDKRNKEKKSASFYMSLNEHQAIEKLLNEGKGDYQIAKILGRDRQTVTDFLKRKGLK